MESAETQKERMLEAFERAAQAGQIEAHYQPIFSMVQNRFVGVEPLVRWRHPRDGIVDAAELISALKSAGRIPQLTHAMLKQIAADIEDIDSFGANGLDLFINMTPEEWSDPYLHETLRLLAVLAQRGRKIVIEFSELSFANDGLRAASETIRNAGHQVAVDDFSSGHSSLPRIVDLDPKYVKFDHTLAKLVNWSPKSNALLSGLIALFRGTESTVIAEGVETREQMEWLKNKGCDLAQGFFITRPCAADELQQKMETFCYRTQRIEGTPQVQEKRRVFFSRKGSKELA